MIEKKRLGIQKKCPVEKRRTKKSRYQPDHNNVEEKRARIQKL